jgi:hypothetical protein
MFDNFVAQTKPSWKRRALIVASLSAHVIAGVVLGVWSILHVEEIAPPAVSLTFFSAPPPPPPPPPKKKKSTPTEKKPETQPKVMTQPDPSKLQQPKIEEKKPETKDDDDGEEDGSDDGQKGGQKGGLPGGLPTGTPGGNGPPQPKAPPAAPPKTVAGFTLIAQQLSHPNPHLPEAVMASRPHQDIKGMYKVCIKNDGHISDVFTMTGIAGADEQIAAQIKSGWVYKPQPVPICFVAALTFKVP